jgi:hypothetical protein
MTHARCTLLARGRKSMSDCSRRALLGGAVAVATSAILAEPAHGQYVWQKPDWPAGDFDALVRSPRRIKQVIHAHEINGARFLSNAKNSLNGLRFGSGFAEDQVQLICALNGPSSMLNYSDYVWQKYRVGEWTRVNDPKTQEPAERNIFYLSGAGNPPHYASEDPGSEGSLYQSISIQALESRGVRFLACHTSAEEAARALIKQNNLSAEPEEVVKDMQAHALPGVLIVPSLAGALAILQCEGHYSYMMA